MIDAKLVMWVFGQNKYLGPCILWNMCTLCFFVSEETKICKTVVLELIIHWKILCISFSNLFWIEVGLFLSHLLASHCITCIVCTDALVPTLEITPHFINWRSELTELTVHSLYFLLLVFLLLRSPNKISLSSHCISQLRQLKLKLAQLFDHCSLHYSTASFSNLH